MPGHHDVLVVGDERADLFRVAKFVENSTAERCMVGGNPDASSQSRHRLLLADERGKGRDSVCDHPETAIQRMDVASFVDFADVVQESGHPAGLWGTAASQGFPDSEQVSLIRGRKPTEPLDGSRF